MPQVRSARAEPLFDGCPFVFLLALTAMVFLCLHLQYSWIQRSVEMQEALLESQNSLKEVIPLLKEGGGMCVTCYSEF
jgi:hypothetical protein